METVDKKRKIQHVRFSDAHWYGRTEEVTVGGAGGIGSWVALFLSRIGHKINIFDMDTVDNTNMGGQCSTYSQVGNSKVDAVKNVCEMFSKESIQINNARYDDQSETSNVVITCFDNMESRKIMFNRWKQLYAHTKNNEMLFIDGRMTAETGQIYFVTPSEENFKRYEDTLFSDDEVPDLPCSFKATTHNGAMIASQIVSGLNNHMANLKEGFEYRDVPFSIKYSLDVLMYETES